MVIPKPKRGAPWVGTAGRGLGSVPRTRANREKPLSRSRVLLVDDHEEFLAVEARLLEPEFEVVTAVRDGRSALEEAARINPDLIILDITMSRIDGIETARHLRASGSRAKIVFL